MHGAEEAENYWNKEMGWICLGRVHRESKVGGSLQTTFHGEMAQEDDENFNPVRCLQNIRTRFITQATER